MRKILTLVFIVNIITIKLYPQDIKKAFADAEKQTLFMLQEIEKAKETQVKKNPNLLFPCSLTKTGEMKLVAATDWRSGFFPGVLWYLYEYTGNNDWKERAGSLNAKIENERVKQEFGLKFPYAGEDIIHYSTLPWLDFTAVNHARKYKAFPSVPKISFGKLTKEGEKMWMPVDIHVNHALMDGFHVGKYVERFQELLNDRLPNPL